MSADLRTAWVIGASSGIGRCLVETLAANGITVSASARSEDALRDLEGSCSPGRVRAVPLDVTDPKAVAAAVSEMSDAAGLPDVIVLTAAAYEPAAADDLDPEMFRDMVTVNYLGAVNVLSAALPPLLARGNGHIAITASVAGYRGLPLASAYGPTKAALINLCESLQPELAVRGVHLQLINPGFVKTPLTDKNEFAMPFMISPEEAASRIYRGLKSGRFEITFPKRFTWIMKVMRMLPYGLYFPLIRAATGVRKRAAEKRS
ncbi:MAG: SDR family NAD(P)-dependent oxidoreductase [Alphaproteobacteria bacterium]|nr:SDR family NAD(P)-dependent oxidoreductase [Alphaproteobacteria bacterium]